MWNISDSFPLWGATGSEPADGSFYSGTEQVPDVEINYLWDSLDNFEANVESALTDIDGDADGIVDAADTTALYKNTDIDSNGNGIVDIADNFTDTYRGSSLDTDFQTSTLTETIGASESKYLSQTTLQDGETIDLYGVTLTTLDGSAVNAAVEIVSIASGTATVEQTVVTTDTTNTTASYTNTTGSTQIIAIRLTNNATSETEYYSDLTTRLP